MRDQGTVWQVDNAKKNKNGLVNAEFSLRAKHTQKKLGIGRVFPMLSHSAGGRGFQGYMQIRWQLAIEFGHIFVVHSAPPTQVKEGNNNQKP